MFTDDVPRVLRRAVSTTEAELLRSRALRGSYVQGQTHLITTSMTHDYEQETIY